MIHLVGVLSIKGGVMRTRSMQQDTSSSQYTCHTLKINSCDPFGITVVSLGGVARETSSESNSRAYNLPPLGKDGNHWPRW